MAERLSENRWQLEDGELVIDGKSEIVGPGEVLVDYRHVPRIMIVTGKNKEVCLSGNDFLAEVKKVTASSSKVSKTWF